MGSKQFGGINLYCNALVGIKEKKAVGSNISLPFPKFAVANSTARLPLGY